MNLWEIEFLKAMRGLSLMYGKECPREILDLYRTILHDLSVEQLIEAVALWIEDPKHVFFPLPAQLKEMVQPRTDTVGDAALIADRLWTALCRYSSDVEGEKKAKAFINSESGWGVVENQGGWSSFLRTNNISEADVTTLKAQWRTAIQAVPSFRRQKSPGLVRLGELLRHKLPGA